MENQLSEKEIRQIVQDEMFRNYRAGTTMVPPHQHNGNDNLKVNETNLARSIKATGNITLATEGQTYTLNVISNPSQVLFYGAAIKDSNHKALINGNAQLSQSYYFQTGTSTTVVPGTFSNIIQCSNALYIDTLSSPPKTAIALTDTDNPSFIFAWDETLTTLVDAIVTSFTSTTVNIKVRELATGWRIEGYFLVI